MSPLSPAEFATKWIGSTRTERAASQEHFIDLCRMLEVPTPNEADPYGDDYAFEKGAGKVSGGDGFADVWKRGHFAWEYKGKRKDLKAAYQQLLQYRERSEERVNRRNGYRERDFDCRAGSIALRVPKLRQGTYYPEWLFEQRRRAERALTARSWAAPGPEPEGNYRPVTPSPKDHDVAFSLAA